MTHDEWLAERKKGIGGSDAGAICGMNKYRSPFEVYADKLDLIPPKEDNEAMRLGRDLEEYVAKRFTEATGKKVRRKNSFIRSEKYPFAFANVDRLVVGERAGLECKTASALNVKRYKDEEFPEEYYCQCMHYMAVTGYKRWYLAALILGVGLKVFTIERDESEIEALMNIERDFWEHVEKRIPPIVGGSESDTDVVNALYPDADTDSSIKLIGFSERLKKRSELKELKKKIENEIAEIDNAVKLYMGDAETAVNDNYKATWKQYRRTEFDVARYVKDTGADLSDYMKESTFRRFSIKEVNHE
jgi:putative phage-type endonuclease